MTDTAIVGRNVEVRQTTVNGMSAFSWGAALAGAVAATAVSFILISLGSGIGLLAASPYSSGPSLATLTVAGAVWIVLAQTWGHAVGGYLAGRMRTFATLDPPDEADFRDGAHGFVSWAMGVLMTIAMIATAGMFTIGLTGHMASTLGAGGVVAAGQQTRPGTIADPGAYFTDQLLRVDRPQGQGVQVTTPSAPGMTTPQAVPPTADTEGRAEVGRIMSLSISRGELSADDRTYLARVVAARTGLNQEEANRRVTEVENRMKAYAKETADKAAKAGAMLSFWTFMSLIMGAAAAVVGGILGGNHRDDNLGIRRIRTT